MATVTGIQEEAFYALFTKDTSVVERVEKHIPDVALKNVCIHYVIR
jgi:hypothetical protein